MDLSCQTRVRIGARERRARACRRVGVQGTRDTQARMDRIGTIARSACQPGNLRQMTLKE
ncbi:hypothetical protein GIY62_16485 [Burkholderia plantarii]|uniref:hypothetical protein n=1 Tax=Burkholderia plantarii TaxID=41899 RepID=UPI000F4F469D|nr:hypothetical protein [Burkholderia plantarii]WLE58698.1 hypothetical protein GIY62_16485 [Burkholderia plantarii]